MGKKTLAGALLVGLVGAVALGLPYYDGVRAQHRFEARLEQLSQAGGAHFRLESYERGWFSSRATSVMEIQARGRPLRMEFDHRIAHGPTFGNPAMARVVSVPRVPEAYRDELRYYFGERAPLTVTTVVGLGGDETSRISSPAYDGPVHGEPGTRLHWGGLDGSVHLAKGDAALELDLRSSGLAASDPKARLKVGALRLSGHMRRLQPQVWVGDSRLDLASLDFQPLDQPAGRVAATRLRLVTHQWQQPDPALQTIGLDLASDNLTVDGLQLGPSRYAMELRNIDIQSYSTLQQQLQAVRQAGLTPEEQSQRAAFVVLAALPGLLERHPELAITHLDSDTPQGPLRASLKVAYTGDGPPPMAAPAALLLQLKARADLQLPKPMVSALMRRRIAQQVSTHARQAGETPAPEELARRTDAALQAELELVTREGWLRADERTYRTQLSFDRGRLTVNGADGGALLNLLGH